MALTRVQSEMAGAGQVLQVVSATKSDTFSNTSNAMADVTGLSVSITPKFTTSKILIFININLSGQDGSAGAAFQIVRNSTAIGIGDSEGSRPRASGLVPYIANVNVQTAASTSFLDSPNTTSSTTYKVQVAGGIAPTGSSGAYVNRTEQNQNSNYYYNTRTASTITVMEIAQ